MGWRAMPRGSAVLAIRLVADHGHRQLVQFAALNRLPQAGSATAASRCELSFRNANYLRNIPEWGQRLYEALQDIDGQNQTLAQQVNGNPKGLPKAPPSIAGLSVVAQDGFFNIAIQHQADFYRGVNYTVEHADNPHFTDPHSIDLGSSRMHTINLGAATRYWRASASYASSPPGPWAYFGGSMPTPVSGGGTGTPLFQSSQGSGTGNPGQGLQGPGTVPFRSANGRPPTR